MTYPLLSIAVVTIGTFCLVLAAFCLLAALPYIKDWFRQKQIDKRIRTRHGRAL